MLVDTAYQRGPQSKQEQSMVTTSENKKTDIIKDGPYGVCALTFRLGGEVMALPFITKDPASYLFMACSSARKYQADGKTYDRGEQQNAYAVFLADNVSDLDMVVAVVLHDFSFPSQNKATTYMDEFIIPSLLSMGVQLPLSGRDGQQEERRKDTLRSRLCDAGFRVDSGAVDALKRFSMWQDTARIMDVLGCSENDASQKVGHSGIVLKFPGEGPARDFLVSMMHDVFLALGADIRSYAQGAGTLCINHAREDEDHMQGTLGVSIVTCDDRLTHEEVLRTQSSDITQTGLRAASLASLVPMIEAYARNMPKVSRLEMEALGENADMDAVTAMFGRVSSQNAHRRFQPDIQGWCREVRAEQGMSSSGEHLTSMRDWSIAAKQEMHGKSVRQWIEEVWRLSRSINDIVVPSTVDVTAATAAIENQSIEGRKRMEMSASIRHMLNPDRHIDPDASMMSAIMWDMRRSGVSTIRAADHMVASLAAAVGFHIKNTEWKTLSKGDVTWSLAIDMSSAVAKVENSLRVCPAVHHAHGR